MYVGAAIAGVASKLNRKRRLFIEISEHSLNICGHLEGELITPARITDRCGVATCTAMAGPTVLEVAEAKAVAAMEATA